LKILNRFCGAKIELIQNNEAALKKLHQVNSIVQFRIEQTFNAEKFRNFQIKVKLKS